MNTSKCSGETPLPVKVIPSAYTDSAARPGAKSVRSERRTVNVLMRSLGQTILKLTTSSLQPCQYARHERRWKLMYSCSTVRLLASARTEVTMLTDVVKLFAVADVLAEEFDV